MVCLYQLGEIRINNFTRMKNEGLILLKLSKKLMQFLIIYCKYFPLNWKFTLKTDLKN